jgi:hypothetical protein
MVQSGQRMTKRQNLDAAPLAQHHGASLLDHSAAVAFSAVPNRFSM